MAFRFQPSGFVEVGGHLVRLDAIDTVTPTENGQTRVWLRSGRIITTRQTQERIVSLMFDAEQEQQ